jgi:prepilin-type N-terminal cleavage/methylation domain-containing protein
MRAQSGFSVIEVLAAVFVFGLISAGIMTVYMSTSKYRQIIFDQLAGQAEGRKAVQDFINDIRTANYSSTGAYPLVNANTSSIIFYSDVDGDTFRERVRYFLASSTLKRGLIKPAGTPLAYVTSSEILTDEVHDVFNTSSVFYYYDQNYTGTSTPLTQPVNVSNVRLIEIRLRIEKDPIKSPVPLYVQTKTEIRNLKAN